MKKTQAKPTVNSLEKTVSLLMAQVESLSRQNESLVRDNANLVRDVQENSKQVVELTKKLSEANKTIDELLERIKLINQRHFGSKSEKINPDQLSLFNEMENAYAPDISEPELDDVLPKTKPRRRGGKRVIDYSKFETLVIEHELSSAERTCSECGRELEEMKIEITRRIRIVPAHLVVEEHRRHVYKCDKCCKQNASGKDTPSVIVRAPQAEGPIPGSFASASLISYIINAKYTNSLPLYRIENDFKTLGMPISRQNMSNWVMNVHVRWLSKIHERMKEILLTHQYIHADETSIQVLKEPNREADKKSRMWLFCSAECDIPIYLYHYDETRSKKVAQDFLRGFSGVLTTDGYQPYFNLGLPNITNVACLVHVRRKFAEIIKTAGGDAQAKRAENASLALEARNRIDEIFATDSKFDDMDAHARKAARDIELAPLMESFIVWAHDAIKLASPGLALYRAFEYAIKYWPYVMNVLSDGNLVLSNNIAERAIKPFVIGRKNWLFSNTPRGACASAAMYSIVTTAKTNGLNPRAYIQWLLEEMPNAKSLDGDHIDKFLPWSECIPEEIKLDAKRAKIAREMADDPIIDIDEEVFRDEGDEN